MSNSAARTDATTGPRNNPRNPNASTPPKIKNSRTSGCNSTRPPTTHGPDDVVDAADHHDAINQEKHALPNGAGYQQVNCDGHPNQRRAHHWDDGGEAGSQTQQQGRLHAHDAQGDPDQHALRHPHREDAVNIGDDGVGDIPIQPRHLLGRKREERSRAIRPLRSVAKQKEHDHKRDQRVDDEAGDTTQNVRAEADQPDTDLLRVGADHGVQIVLGKIDPAANIAGWDGQPGS